MDWEKLLSPRRLRQSSGSPSQVKGDVRDEFDRDLDRIVYSTPFRRMQDKTQVFPLDPNDSVRTRLTHSLEVSQAAKGLSKDVCDWMIKKKHIAPKQAKCIQTIAATCGLIHDLGNPPFGHSGEKAIQDWFAKTGILNEMDTEYVDDFRHFDGNAQTLRLLTKLQLLADFHGLNLTCGTLSAACKYVAGSEEIDEQIQECSKLGHFSSENDVVEKIRDVTRTQNHRNPITFLVEAADDAVYNTIDIEDGFKKQILDWPLIQDELRNEAGDDPVLEEIFAWVEKRVAKTEANLQGRAQDSARVKFFRVRAIGKILTSAAETFQKNYDAIMMGQYHGELVLDSRAGALVRACKKLNQSRVYCSDETLKLELMGKKIIWDLMDIFWEGVRCPDGNDGKQNHFAKKAYSLLSSNYKQVFKHATSKLKLPDKYCRIQLVTDYICGMTDTYAVDLHKRVTNG